MYLSWTRTPTTLRAVPRLDHDSPSGLQGWLTTATSRNSEQPQRDHTAGDRGTALGIVVAKTIRQRDGSFVQILSAASYGFEGPQAIAVDGSDIWVANEYGNSVTELSAFFLP
jgi:hypothetical protein